MQAEPFFVAFLHGPERHNGTEPCSFGELLQRRRVRCLPFSRVSPSIFMGSGSARLGNRERPRNELILSGWRVAVSQMLEADVAVAYNREAGKRHERTR
jgi:hypothetical protein